DRQAAPVGRDEPQAARAAVEQHAVDRVARLLARGREDRLLAHAQHLPGRDLDALAGLAARLLGVLLGVLAEQHERAAAALDAAAQLAALERHGRVAELAQQRGRLA